LAGEHYIWVLVGYRAFLEDIGLSKGNLD